MLKGFKALLAGVITGTALGVLFSPKKGEEFRNEVKKDLEEGGTGLTPIKETLTKMGKEIGEFSKETYEKVSQSECGKKGAEKAKEYAKKGKEIAKDIMEDIDEKIPAKTKKKVKKTVKKAVKTAKKSVKTAKKNAQDIKKKVEKKVNAPKKKK